MSENILEIRHLGKSFGTHEVLRDIDFTVKKGDVISIIGASGSGKSTLLRCVNLLETFLAADFFCAAAPKEPLKKAQEHPLQLQHQDLFCDFIIYKNIIANYQF